MSVAGIAPAARRGARRWLSRARRLVWLIVARRELRGCELEGRVAVTGHVVVERRGGRVSVGRGALFVGGLRPTELLCSAGSRIRVGEGTVVNYATRISADGADVTIGRRCLLGSEVRLLARPGAPIEIGDDVWIAHGAVIEGGVRVGPGSVVAAAGVVTRDVPPRSLAIGHPSRSMSLDLALHAPNDQGIHENRRQDS